MELNTGKPGAGERAQLPKTAGLCRDQIALLSLRRQDVDRLYDL